MVYKRFSRFYDSTLESVYECGLLFSSKQPSQRIRHEGRVAHAVDVISLDTSSLSRLNKPMVKQELENKKHVLSSEKGSYVILAGQRV